MSFRYGPFDAGVRRRPGQIAGVDRYIAAVNRACDNCGFETADLHVVRRVYLTPETWDTPASRRVIDERESWCTSCVTQYPHEAADDAD